MANKTVGEMIWEYLEENDLFSSGFVSKDKKKDVFIAWLDSLDSKIEDFGIKQSTWRKLLARNILIDKPTGQDWKVRLYLLVGLKRCCGCKTLQDVGSFLTGQKRCQPCFQEYRDANREVQKERAKQHYRDNKEAYKLRSVDRRASYGRTSLEEEQEALREFYRNCPEGYEVDHIIPLKGKTVSGLHRLCNLQYLSKKHNRQKSNKLLEEHADGR